MRSFGELAAIAAQPVCPERIYRNEKDIEFVFSFREGIRLQCRRENSQDQEAQKKRTRMKPFHSYTLLAFIGLFGNGMFSFSVSYFMKPQRYISQKGENSATSLS